MGIYRHLAAAQLAEMRDSLLASLHQRLTAPTSATSDTGRQVQYQQRTEEIRRELQQITAEIDGREGVSTRGPIYMV